MLPAGQDVGPRYLLLLGLSSSLDRQGKGSGACVSIKSGVLEEVVLQSIHPTGDVDWVLSSARA